MDTHDHITPVTRRPLHIVITIIAILVSLSIYFSCSGNRNISVPPLTPENNQTSFQPLPGSRWYQNVQEPLTQSEVDQAQEPKASKDEEMVLMLLQKESMSALEEYIKSLSKSGSHPSLIQSSQRSDLPDFRYSNNGGENRRASIDIDKVASNLYETLKEKTPAHADLQESFLQDGVSKGHIHPHTAIPPLGNMLIEAGTLIPAIMAHGLISEIPGTILARTTQDVYDSMGSSVMLPAGGTVIGTFHSSVKPYQKRLLVVWLYYKFPVTNETLPLEKMQSVDGQDLLSGIKGKVNRHYFELLSSAALMGGMTAAASIVDRQLQNSEDQEISNALFSRLFGLGGTLTQVVTNVLQEVMNRPAEIKIDPAKEFNILVTKDIYLRPYNPEEK